MHDGNFRVGDGISCGTASNCTALVSGIAAETDTIVSTAFTELKFDIPLVWIKLVILEGDVSLEAKGEFVLGFSFLIEQSLGSDVGSNIISSSCASVESPVLLYCENEV